MGFERFLWSGCLLGVAATVRRTPYWSPRHWQALQDKRVRQMVAHAYDSVPFYRAVMDREGLKPSHFTSVADLQRLPLISKDTVVEAPDRFFSARHEKKHCLELRTSGTTGTPTSFWHDKRSLLLNVAYGEREQSVLRALRGTPATGRLMIFRQTGSSFVSVQKYYGQHLFRPGTGDDKRATASTANPFSNNIDQLNDFKPDVVSAHGSYLGALFRYAEEHRMELHRPRVALYCADELSDADRALITQTFQVSVASVYRSAEALKIGFTCERGAGFHVHPDLCALSIVDERGVAVGPGRTGEIVISNLLNRATVLLNYRTGDLGTLDPSPCDCGRTFPRLNSLEGQTAQFVQLPGGRAVEPHRFKSAFTTQPGVRRYQVVQREPARFHVKILPTGELPEHRIEAELRKRLHNLLGDSVGVDFQFVQDFPLEPGRKFRPIIPLPNEKTPGPGPGAEAPA